MYEARRQQWTSPRSPNLSPETTENSTID